MTSRQTILSLLWISGFAVVFFGTLYGNLVLMNLGIASMGLTIICFNREISDLFRKLKLYPLTNRYGLLLIGAAFLLYALIETWGTVAM